MFVTRSFLGLVVRSTEKGRLGRMFSRSMAPLPSILDPWRIHSGRTFLSHAWVLSVPFVPSVPSVASHRTRVTRGNWMPWTWFLPVCGAKRSIRVATRSTQRRASEVFKLNHFRFPSNLLEQGRKSVQEALSQCSDSHIYLVRSFGRSSTFREMTCGQLEQLLPNLNSCRLVLAADDPDLHTYSANAGPWGSRIIMGVKGAERQIAFIDQISPLGRGLSDLVWPCYIEFVLGAPKRAPELSHSPIQYEVFATEVHHLWSLMTISWSLWIVVRHWKRTCQIWFALVFLKCEAQKQRFGLEATHPTPPIGVLMWTLGWVWCALTCWAVAVVWWEGRSWFSPSFVPHGPILSGVVFGHPHFFPVSFTTCKIWFVSQVRCMLWYGCNSRRVSVFALWPSDGWHRAILSFLWTRWCHCALGQIASIQEARF